MIDVIGVQRNKMHEFHNLNDMTGLIQFKPKQSNCKHCVTLVNTTEVKKKLFFNFEVHEFFVYGTLVVYIYIGTGKQYSHWKKLDLYKLFKI